MLTHDIIRKLVLTGKSMSKKIDEINDCENNRRKIIHIIKKRNTVNESNSEDDCNMSYLSTRANDIPLRPRLAVSHTVCNYC
jgi:hypothetical protein